MHSAANNRLITYDKQVSGQKFIAVRIGELKYLANESDRIAREDGFNKKTTVQAKMKANIGPKNLCVCPKASRK